MKKTIPFTNDIKFNTKIFEISSISLEHSLKLNNDNLIKGEFLISGDYKITCSSINDEPFIYSLPFDIALDDKYDSSSIEIDIDDFSYEIVNEEILRVNIIVLLDGIKLIKEEEIVPDIFINEKEEKIQKEEKIEFPKIDPIVEEPIVEIIDVNEEEPKEEREEIIDLFKENDQEAIPVMNETNNVFNNFEETEEYVTYYVHIIRGDDNLESICTKYEVTKEDIEKYNNLDDITLGSKIIIPYINESI